jgi:putative ABC transport system permease protein
MGRLWLVARLVISDVKRRKGQALLLVIIIVLTTAALTLALALRRPDTGQFSRTRAATRGPDLVAELASTPGGARPTPAQLTPLRSARGVRATAGPYPIAFVRLTGPHGGAAIQAEGRDRTRGVIDRPLLASGTWVKAGRAVIERGLAASLAIRVGDQIRLGDRQFTVGGIAYSTAQPFYPANSPGVVWLTRRDATRLATSRQRLGYLLDIALRDPASALDALGSPAWNALGQRLAGRHEPSLVDAWPLIRNEDYKLIRLNHKVLLVGSLLLTMLAIASIAVLVAGRMAQQTRRVGLLKAIGATPTLIAATLLAENILLAVAAGFAGVIAGELVMPTLSNAGQGLVGTSPTPHPTTGVVAAVVALAAIIAAAATSIPAIQAARTSTVRALADAAHAPRRRPWLIALSGWVPTEFLLGLRIAARRVRRTVLTGAGLLIAVAMVVAALAVQQSIQTTARRQPGPVSLASSHGIDQQANHVLIVLGVILVSLAAITAAFTAWATVIDAQRSTALARALGATPRQINASLITAQLLAALPAASLGIPAGLLLYEAAGGHLSEAPPPLLSLLAVIPITLAAVALISAIPIRIGARRPVADILRAD